MKTNLSPTIAVEHTRSIRERSESIAIATEVVLIACGTLLLALLAQVSIPMSPVPITGQSLGVLLLGAALGTRRSVASVLAYLGLGAVGLPVFAGGLGVATLLGPTGGYLWSFVPAAAAVGYLCERKWDRRFLGALLAFALGHVIIFAGGVAWLACLIGFPAAISGGLVPFLPGVVVKTLIATSLLPLLWGLSASQSVRHDDAASK
jgi:biotin transport system substrate-specific component